MAEEKAEKKGKKNNLVVIIVAVIVCIGAFAGSYIYFSSKGSDKPKEKVVKEAYLECGDPIIINLADENAKRYLKVKFTIGYDSKNKKLTEEVEAKLTVIRDAVIFHFKNLKAEDLKAQDEEAIKAKLIESINEKLAKGKLEGIYFDEYTLQ